MANHMNGNFFGASSNDFGRSVKCGALCFLLALAVPWTVWADTEQQKLTASDGAPGDYFGRSIALDGNLALIGALGDDDAAQDGRPLVQAHGADLLHDAAEVLDVVDALGLDEVRPGGGLLGQANDAEVDRVAQGRPRGADEELEAALKKILPNKKAVLETVRDAVYDAGVEPNMYRVWDNNLDSAVAPTMARIEELFGK